MCELRKILPSDLQAVGVVVFRGMARYDRLAKNEETLAVLMLQTY